MHGRMRKGAANQYIPDSAQMLKGNSLKAQHIRRKQLLQRRQCSFDRKKVSKGEQGHTPFIYNSVGHKYQSFETIDDQDLLLRFIQYQRIKQSQSSKRSIKLISQSYHQAPKQQGRPKTSNSLREKGSNRVVKDRAHSQTITYQQTPGNTSNMLGVTNGLSASPATQGQVRFDSINLDPRLNEDINVVLRSKSKASMDITNADLKQLHDQQEKESHRNTIQEHLNTLQSFERAKVRTAGFVRQMKRNKKSRSSARDNRTQEDSQLVKALMHQTARTPTKITPYSTLEGRKTFERMGEGDEIRQITHRSIQHSYLNDHLGLFLRRKR